MPDTETDYTFMVVACTRLVVSGLGFFLIFYFKLTHGIARFREQAKGGLPVNASYKTAIGIALLVVNAPAKGMWVVGHLLCMASSFVGSLYLMATIFKSGEYFGDATIAPYQRFCYGFRSLGSIIVIPLCLVQVGLVLLGRYGHHRWLGRTLVHAWTWITVASLLVQESLTGYYELHDNILVNRPSFTLVHAVFVISMAILVVETLVYFGFKFSSEVLGCCSAEEPEEEVEEPVAAKAIEISAMADTYVMPTKLQLPKSTRSLPKHAYLQDDWIFEVAGFEQKDIARPPQTKKVPRVYKPVTR